MNELKKNSMIVFLIKVISAGLALIVNAYITNHLTNNSAGMYYLMMSIILFLNPIGIAGFNNFILKKSATLKDVSDRTVINGILLKCAQSSFFIGMLVVFIFIILFDIINDCFLSNKVDIATYIYLLLSVPFFSLGTILTHALQGIGRVKSCMFISGPIIQIFILTPAFIIGADSSNEVSLCYLISSVLFFVISLFVWLMNNGVGYVNFKKRNIDLIKDNMNHMLIQVLGVVYLSLSQLLLGLTSNVSDVARFAICIKVSTLLSFVLQAVNKVVAPRFSALYHKNMIAELKDVVKSSTRILICTCLPIVIFVYVFAENILNLFGEGYSDSVWILRILVLGQMVNICTGTVSYLLMMTGNEKSHMKNIMISSALALIIGAVAITYIGIYGALIMVCFALITTNMTSWYIVKKKLGINTLQIF